MGDDKIDLKPGFLDRVRLGIGKTVNRVGEPGDIGRISAIREMKLHDFSKDDKKLNVDDPYGNIGSELREMMDKSIFEQLANADTTISGPSKGKPLTYDDLQKAQDAMRASYKPKGSWVNADKYGIRTNYEEERQKLLIRREVIDSLEEWILWLKKNKWNIGVQTGSIRLLMRIEDDYFMTRPINSESEKWNKKMSVTEFINAKESQDMMLLSETVYYKQASGLIPKLKDIINLI